MHTGLVRSIVSALGSTSILLAALLIPSAPSGAATANTEQSALTINPVTNVDASLADVSCTSPSNCMAVGIIYNTSISTNYPISERWNGTAWSAVPVPSAGPISSFDGVSCTTTTSCMAVGSYSPDEASPALIESWNGSTWSIDPTPDVPGGWLNGVSCASPVYCVAVGYGNGPVVETLAELWNGVKWAVMATVNPGTFDTLSSVSCTLNGDSPSCWSVGVSGITEYWNGSTWTLVPSPTEYDLTSVSCLSSIDCATLGNYYTSHDVPQTVTEFWNGTEWTVASDPNPGPFDFFGNVTCVASNDCLADGTSNNDEMIQIWNGSEWSVAPDPVGSDTLIGAIAYVGSGDWFTVGLDNDQPIIELWNGTTWSVVPSPTFLLPATIGTAYLQTLSATGGNPPYSWKLAPQSHLPRGLRLDKKTGVISGTPTARSKETTFTVEVQDTKAGTPPTRNLATASLTLPVDAAS